MYWCNVQLRNLIFLLGYLKYFSIYNRFFVCLFERESCWEISLEGFQLIHAYEVCFLQELVRCCHLESNMVLHPFFFFFFAFVTHSCKKDPIFRKNEDVNEYPVHEHMHQNWILVWSFYAYMLQLVNRYLGVSNKEICIIVILNT